MSGDHNQHQKPVKSYCGGKPNYVASDDMSEKRVQILTENDILDTRFAKRFVDDPYAILSQKDLVAFVRELEAKWIKNETP